MTRFKVINDPTAPDQLKYAVLDGTLNRAIAWAPRTYLAISVAIALERMANDSPDSLTQEEIKAASSLIDLDADSLESEEDELLRLQRDAKGAREEYNELVEVLDEIFSDKPGLNKGKEHRSAYLVDGKAKFNLAQGGNEEDGWHEINPACGSKLYALTRGKQQSNKLFDEYRENGKVTLIEYEDGMVIA